MASLDMTSEPDPLAAAPVSADPGPPLAEPGTVELGAVELGAVGVPYHRLGAPVRRRWWRLAVPLVVLVMVQVVLSVAVALGSLLPERGIPVLGRHTQLAVLFAGIAVCLPLLAAYMWRSGRPFGGLSSVAGRLRRGWLTTCLCVMVTPFLAMAVASVVSRREDWTGWSTFAPAVAVMLALTVFHVATEEYVCRGFVLQSVGSLFATPWPGIVVQAVLYTALLGLGTVPGMIDVLLYAVMLGWLTVRTGGLEAAIAVHVGQSLMGVIVDVATLPAEVTQAAIDKTITDAPWPAVLAHLTMTAIFVSLLDRLAVWGRIARRTPGHTAGQTAGQPLGQAAA
jgi:membrane protease YdiL (CAAX protease family)